MKVDDLMRKDWVMRIDVENPYPVQVHEILAEGVIVDNQNNHYINLPYSDIGPIPLTQEILEKNFTMYDLEYFIPEYPNHNPEENDYFSIYYNKWNGLSTIWKVEYIDGFYSDIETRCASIVSIKYVHDLQQFLRLLKITNIDLKL